MKFTQSPLISINNEFEEEIERVRILEAQQAEKEAAAANLSAQKSTCSHQNLIGRYKARNDATLSKLRQLKGELKLLSFNQIEDRIEALMQFIESQPKP